ncbi:MAG: hypothetical protein D6737_20820 [Chloroflexi bacterium]|nr:MAG: hypothetical protein D6737_20820 [Chloroflexota bacterium]
MPIDKMRFENGIFFAHESGHITGDEAQTWAAELYRHATASETPIVALVDALDVKSVSPQASTIFARATTIDNLICVAVAVVNFVAVQGSRMVSLRGESGRTVIFETFEEAETYARQQVEKNTGNGV